MLPTPLATQRILQDLQLITSCVSDRFRRRGSEIICCKQLLERLDVTARAAAFEHLLGLRHQLPSGVLSRGCLILPL